MVLTFEKIIEPVIPLIKEAGSRLKNDEKLYKLSLYYFMVGLMYAVMNKTKSIRFIGVRDFLYLTFQQQSIDTH